MQPDSMHALYGTLPIGAYVEISQLPYTGFDFGPLGNALYFSVLALIAVSAAYAALYTIPRHSMSIALMRQHRAFAEALQRFIQLISR